jgi:hypothetical protein
MGQPDCGCRNGEPCRVKPCVRGMGEKAIDTVSRVQATSNTDRVRDLSPLERLQQLAGLALKDGLTGERLAHRRMADAATIEKIIRNLPIAFWDDWRQAEAVVDLLSRAMA